MLGAVVELSFFPEDQTVLVMPIPHPGIEDSQREEGLVVLTPYPLILRSPSERLLGEC
jgi:hypothetical protein